jgi:hypothetical protein
MSKILVNQINRFFEQINKLKFKQIHEDHNNGEIVGVEDLGVAENGIQIKQVYLFFYKFIK